MATGGNSCLVGGEDNSLVGASLLGEFFQVGGVISKLLAGKRGTPPIPPSKENPKTTDMHLM